LKKKTSIYFCLIFCFIFLLSACVKTVEKKADTEDVSIEESDSNMTDTGVFPIVKDKITLEFLTKQMTAIPDMETNEFTKYMEEKTNVHIKWNILTDVAANKSVILASGDYPEVLFGLGLTPEEQLLYGGAGSFVPLNDYIDKYSVEFKKICSLRDYVRPRITTPDGNIYALPSVSEAYHMTYSNKMWINTSWLEQLNLDMPDTTDEFYNVLKAFKEKDPNLNGKPDEIPLSGLYSIQAAASMEAKYSSPIHFIMSSFITDDGRLRWVQPFYGELDTIINKPAFREGLRYLSKLYQEGLIDGELFTQDGNILKQKGENPDAVILGAAPANGPHAFTVRGEDRYRLYDVLPPLEGPEKVRTTANVSTFVYQGYFAITDKCKHPEIALRWIDHMYDEEALYRGYFGIEGVDWRRAEPGELGIDGQQAKYTSIQSTAEIKNNNWKYLGPGFMSLDWRLSEVSAQDIYSFEGLEALLYQATKKYDKYSLPFDSTEIFPVGLYVKLEEADEVNKLTSEILTYVSESTARFMTGDLDLDSGWDEYLKTLDKMGLKRFIELYQINYDRVYKK
jgi:putative aldouronate transport system substrate-binding protein